MRTLYTASGLGDMVVVVIPITLTDTIAEPQMLDVYRKAHPHAQSGPKVELPAP